jgi:hypothetical protein
MKSGCDTQILHIGAKFASFACEHFNEIAPIGWGFET